MKDAKFIELLNLYIDHQISPADAALLEAEMQESPHRRRTYRQYCQMHRGCTLVGENFHPQTAPAAGRREFAEAAGPRGHRGWYAAGLVAAAACIALVLVRVSPRSAPGSVTALSRDTAPAAAVAPDSGSAAAQLAATSVRQSARGDDFQVVLTAQALNLFKDDRGASAFPVANAAAPAPDQALLNWMNSVQLQPLPRARSVEGFAFEIDNRPSLAQPANRVFTSNPPPQGGPAAELTAFQFQH